MYGRIGSGRLVMQLEVTTDKFAPSEVRVARSELPTVVVGDRVIVNGAMNSRGEYAVTSVDTDVVVLQRSTKSTHGEGTP